MSRAVRAGALAALMTLAASCGAAAVDPAERVTTVGGRTVSPAEFELFLLRELGDQAPEIDRAARDALHEEFLAELLLAHAAREEGIGVDPSSVETEAERLREAGVEAPADELRDSVRNALLARAYERAVLVPSVSVSAEEVERELGAPRRRGAREFVVFRQIRTEERAAAEEAHRRVARRGESFEEVARESSTAPDRGALQQLALQQLPEPVAGVLRRLPEGSVSRPVEYDGAYYVFAVEARNRDPDPGRAAEREEVRARLLSDKLESLRRERVAEIARREVPAGPAAVPAREEDER